MIKITLCGRLTADPEQREINGRSVVNFRLACDTKKKNEDGKSVPNFFRLSVWGAKADVAMKYLKKGDQIVTIGEFEAREYKANDGTIRTSLDVMVDDFMFTGGGRKAEGEAPAQEAPARVQATSNNTDLPF